MFAALLGLEVIYKQKEIDRATASEDFTVKMLNKLHFACGSHSPILMCSLSFWLLLQTTMTS